MQLRTGKLLFGDCIEIMKKFKENSIDLVFADPPYFLSNGGISCKSGKIVCVDKGEWDKESNKNKIIEFTEKWILESKRVLKSNGTIWITGTFHNIFYIGMTLQKYSFKILNMVSWIKEDPPPNLTKRMLTHSVEFIIWAKRGPTSKQCFNYDILKKMNNGKEMTDAWIMPHVPYSEKSFGYHPTQKPIHLLERIILCSTKENDIVLDPFSGSGTTAVAAIKNNRRFICIEKDKKYYNLSKNRISYYLSLKYLKK
ncbi:Type II DNA methyltransferase M3.BstXII [Bacillus sp. X1(2014)]|nr:Type II DNA methyltransferase M3.BstXII [Bacillus sp. X1(2014)]